MQSHFRSMFAIALLLTAGAGMAAPQAAAPAAPSRMSSCNTQSAGKTGDDRKAFMSSCMKGQTAPPPKMTQQQKMTACNKDASTKALKGDARKSFMSDCLKG
jgi:hypothetical protein